MTKQKVRFTYRMTEQLFETISKQAELKGITLNAEITNVLWTHYFETGKQKKEEKH